MSARKRPTEVMHFTNVANLARVIDNGLVCDAIVEQQHLLSVEAGNPGIKDQRRQRLVLAGHGGHVCDYVPFYFGPRSPMMSAIANGRVPSYGDTTDRLVYLVTTLERLVDWGYLPVLTDRNAALAFAAFREFHLDDPLDDGFIDWSIVSAKYWNDHPSGRERRMAECLVRDRVVWEALEYAVVHNGGVEREVRGVFDERHVSLPIHVRPSWYF